MIRARDVREAIAEQSSTIRERQALEAVADALEHSLDADVPYRPEFKAALRDRLMKEARRSVTPWYRRRAVVWPSMAAAAAAVVMVAGLQFWQVSNRPGTVAEGPRPTGRIEKPGRDGHLVTEWNLPAANLPDERLSPTAGPQATSGVDLTNLKVHLVTGRPDAALFSRMATALDFRATPTHEAGGFSARETTRTLELTVDGYMIYRDFSSAVSDATEMDRTAVRTVAQRFLFQALLPVPGLEPQVTEGPWENVAHLYTVTYTPQVDGFPVVNGRTVVRVSDRGRVVSAEGYIQAGTEARGPFTVIEPARAVEAAQQQGGAAFAQADLVYARTSDGEAIYLQPYWRVFGTTSGGERIARYIPALAER